MEIIAIIADLKLIFLFKASLVLLDDVSDSPDVDDLESRVGRGLDPYHLGVGFNGGRNLSGVGGVHERGLDVHLGCDLPEDSSI